MRGRLAGWFDAMRQPAAAKRGLQKETRPASHIEQAAAIGRQKRFENFQPVGLCQLPPKLVLAGMGEKGRLLLGVIILAIDLFERGGIRQRQGMLEAATLALDD